MTFRTKPLSLILAAEVEQAWGRIDVLVNNAGISSICPAEETSAQQFRRVLEINLTAPFLLSKTFGAKMLTRHEGSIVNVASIAGLVGIGDRVAYNASSMASSGSPAPSPPNGVAGVSVSMRSVLAG